MKIELNNIKPTFEQMPNTMLNTYLGQKGYTILKSEISIQQQHMIREELSIKPYVPGSPANNTAVTFPAYRESALKYYVPRYFGEKMFGPVKEYKIPQGSDINVTFSGDLRDIQKEVVENYLNHLEKHNNYGGGLLELPCGFGKTICSLNILSRLKKKTLVIVSHDIETAVALSDTVFVLAHEGTKKGATIIKEIDLCERGLAWQKGIHQQAAFRDTIQEIKSYL